jgi:hypothetical protein
VAFIFAEFESPSILHKSALEYQTERGYVEFKLEKLTFEL